MEVITVTSQGQDASRFISNFSNSIRLSDNYEVGLLKIAHPPTMNITDKNNKIFIFNKEKFAEATLEVPSGFYETSHDVPQAIYESLMNYNDDGNDEGGEDIPFTHLLPTNEDLEAFRTAATIRYISRQSADNTNLILELVDKKTLFHTNNNSDDNILHFLDFRIKNHSARSLAITNYDLESRDQLGFIYSSIVSNSLIDNRVSRLLDTVAIKSNRNEHSLFEVQNPIFHNVSAASFIDISFEIRGVNGDFMKFHGDLPTVLTLGIRKKRNDSI